MTPQNPWQAARKILCIRLDSLGDVLMTTPALRALKEARPGRSLSLLTSPAGAAVAPLIPELDEVIVYQAPWMKATPPRPDSAAEYAMAERLRRAGFDAAVIFTVFSQNPLPAAMLAYLADIPLRLAHCRENPYQLLTHWAPESDLDPQAGIRHEVRRQLDLAAVTGCPAPDQPLSLQVPRSTHQKLRRRLDRLGLDLACPWVVIHPGASAPSRRYPPEGFARVAQDLIEQHNFQVVFTGSPGEAELISQIQTLAAMRSFSLAGNLDLAELAALLELAPVLISNNTGPAHLAAAVGTPVVDLYALTNPQHTPWGVPHRVLYHDVPCKNCFKSVCPLGHQDCLRRVPPAAVVVAALELFANEGQL